MSLSRFSMILREGVKSTRKPAVLMNRMYSSSAGKEKTFIQKYGLNVIGLPVCALLLFFVLPTFRPSDIHSIDWYDQQYVAETKAKEAAARAAKAAAAK